MRNLIPEIYFSKITIIWTPIAQVGNLFFGCPAMNTKDDHRMSRSTAQLASNRSAHWEQRR